jgi:hypothetical protein
MSLFKDGIIRFSQKSKLKSFFLKEVPTSQQAQSTKLVDGGPLLCCCDWRKNKSFQNLFQKYADLLKYLHINTICV